MHWRPILIILLMLLQSCAQLGQKEAPRVEAAQQDVTGEVTPKPAPPAQKAPIQESIEQTPPLQVMILVTSDIPAYSDVASALARQLEERGQIIHMNGSQIENIKMLAEHKNDKHKQFVSIGLGASVAAKTLTDRQVIFCQVFNYQDYALLTSRHKGVSMMPSLTKTFHTWRALAPKTTDIGVISGPGLEDMIQAAKIAAKSQGITLHHEIVRTDKEYQFAYKQMSNNVQGYWLIPDNRVLSGNALRDVMTFSVRNSKQVVVFNEELLKHGGLFSTASDIQDIAQKVINRIESAQHKDMIPGPDIIYLDDAKLRINSVMAQRLNLDIPENLRKYQDAP